MNVSPEKSQNHVAKRRHSPEIRRPSDSHWNRQIGSVGMKSFQKLVKIKNARVTK
jgi:hypothetical protein